jgi:hypothetical protein
MEERLGLGFEDYSKFKLRIQFSSMLILRACVEVRFGVRFTIRFMIANSARFVSFLHFLNINIININIVI